MTLPLIGDLVVALLLVATIGYATVLNRRLGVLRGDKAKLEELTQILTAASMRAEAGIQGLRQAAEDVGRQLDKKVAVGRSLADDLTYLTERGGSLADRLEGTIRAHRAEKKSPSGAPRPVEPQRADANHRADADKVMPLRTEPLDEPAARRAQLSRAERELFHALSGRR